MSHTKMNYFETEDVLHVTLSDELEPESVDISQETGNKVKRV